MKYLVCMKAIFLMVYFFILSLRPSRFFVLAVFRALVLASIGTCIHMFKLMFMNGEIPSKATKKSDVQYEAILFHGLSAEEWRTAEKVKITMDNLNASRSFESEEPLDFYFSALLMMAFSGLIKYRPETAEERAHSFTSVLPEVGDILMSNKVDSSKNEIVARQDYETSSTDTQFFSALARNRIDYIRERFYQGSTLSRFVYDGVRIVFVRDGHGTTPTAD